MSRNKRRQNLSFVLGAILALVSLTLACSSSSKSSSTGSTGSTSGGASSSTSGTQPQTPSSASQTASVDNLPSVVEKVRPATVQITTKQVQINQFSQPFSIPTGVGSGVIYDSNGDILTNNHVVEGAQQLEVSLPDGRSFAGRLLGADPPSDLAVVKIDGSNLPVAKLGDSTKLRVGDWTIAIGNALGLPGGPTVTQGVVSALGRAVQEPASQGGGGPGSFLFGLIQTSAAINPGNSGGPLVNLAGEVIGINTLVAGEAEPGIQAQGIGFAISISSAKSVADQLASGGQVKHAYLGVSYVPLTPAIAAQLGVKTSQGAVVVDTAAGSPAAKAGLQRGDVITQVDGQNVANESDLARLLAQRKPGDSVSLTVVNGSNTRNVTVQLGEAPATAPGP